MKVGSKVKGVVKEEGRGVGGGKGKVESRWRGVQWGKGEYQRKGENGEWANGEGGGGCERNEMGKEVTKGKRDEKRER